MAYSIRQPIATLRLAAVACLLLAAQNGPSQTLPRTQLAGKHVPEAIAVSRLVAPAPRDQRLNLAIGLPLRNQPQLDALLADLTDPASPRYRQYLTPAQFAAQFGPTADDYQALIRFAQQHNLSIAHTHPNNLVLSVSGTVSDIESAFQTRLNTYANPTRGQFYAPETEPSVPNGLSVADIAGLDDFAPPQPMDVRTAPLAIKANVTGSGPGGYFIGGDFRAAYAPGVALTGSGQSVGLLEFDGFFPGDVTRNFAAANLPAVPISTVLLDGYSGAAGSSNTEVILDIVMAAYMAPGVAKITVYEGVVPNDILNRMATDDSAAQLSSSWTFGGVNATTESIFREFAAQGQTLFQASGDSGAYTSGVASPADDPALTVVGGTSLVTAGPGGAWQSESAWSNSGGGVSTAYPIPAWQQGLNMAARGGSTTMRNIPDVALTGDVQMYLICNNGQAISVGGTSAAAPLWAGFLALANQQAIANRKPLVGFLNPALYGIGTGGTYGSNLHDIAAGSNGRFRALAGYDLTTGWGSPAGLPLIEGLTGTTPTPSFTLTASASTLSIRSSATATDTITVDAQGGFTGAPTLTLSGLPTGVVATFSPPYTATSSTLTLTAAANAAAGTYSLTVKGVYGSLTTTTRITLTVVIPTFTLASSPSSATVIRPGGVATIVSAAALNGFTGNVALSVPLLPAGIAARFSPSTVAPGTSIASSTLTLTVSSATLPGTYLIPIAGTSGPLSAATQFALTVGAPAFTLSAAATAFTIVRPNSVSTLISISPVNGFNGSVFLTAANLPHGVTATYSPASASPSAPSILTLTASNVATAGISTIYLFGISGSLSSSIPITLAIQSPSFTLSPSAATVTLARPATGTNSGTTGISLVPLYGFNQPVTLSATGLPPGVTAAFNPTIVTPGNPSILTLAVAAYALAATTPIGNFPITVTGNASSLQSSIGVTLDIPPPTIAIAFSYTTVTLKRGSTALAKLIATTAPGFTGPIAFTQSALPLGMSVTQSGPFGPATDFVVAATAATAPGTYPIVFTATATSGAATATATLTATVQ